MLARTATSLGASATTRTGACTRRCLAAALIGLPGRMRGGARPFLFPHKSGFSGVAGLDAFIRFLLYLLVGLHLLLARRRRLLSQCRHGDGSSKSNHDGKN